MTPRDIWRWVAQRFYGVLDNIIATLILAGVAYLISVTSGLLPGIVIPGPVAIPLVIATIIMLPVLILAVVVLRLSKKKASHKLPYNPALIWYTDPLLVDNTHRFLLIQQTYLIDGYDGTFVLRYHGKNATNQMSQCFRDGVAGDSVADTSLMAIKVVDKAENVPLTWKLLKDEPYKKLIEIYFRQPLNFGDEFDIEFSCRWPGTFTRREDYVFYPMHHYKHGVKRLVGELILNAAPIYVRGIRRDGKKTMLEPVQPQIQRRENKFVVTWEIENPKHIYILYYGRQDI